MEPLGDSSTVQSSDPDDGQRRRRKRRRRPRGEESSVDLSTLNETSGSSGGKSFTDAEDIDPTFKIYFDLAFMHMPGIENRELTFSNIHSFLMFEYSPIKRLHFTFDVASGNSFISSPSYFELSYDATSRLKVRGGKIWIPFDDIDPHNIFGGRTNTQRIGIPGKEPFLPDLWTDLGLGLRYTPIERSALTVTTDLYVVNGFGGGGKDPRGTSNDYPSFNNIAIDRTDNNKDKAVGARLHALFGRKFGLGFSGYSARWTSQNAAAKRMMLLGTDGQLRFGATELRGGMTYMDVEIENDDFLRGGWYGELGQKFGTEQAWKALFRFGYRQNDSRVIDVTDQRIVGGSILYKPSFVQFSLEHSRDLETGPAKANKTLTMARVAIEM